MRGAIHGLLGVGLCGCVVRLACVMRVRNRAHVERVVVVIVRAD
jgi:hypothetical protein